MILNYENYAFHIVTSYSTQVTPLVIPADCFMPDHYPMTAKRNICYLSTSYFIRYVSVTLHSYFKRTMFEHLVTTKYSK